jgi:hypothetical protein
MVHVQISIGQKASREGLETYMKPMLRRTMRPILMRSLRLRFQKTTVGKTARKRSVAELKAVKELVSAVPVMWTAQGTYCSSNRRT